jgi:hypothetical protein
VCVCVCVHVCMFGCMYVLCDYLEAYHLVCIISVNTVYLRHLLVYIIRCTWCVGVCVGVCVNFRYGSAWGTCVLTLPVC